MSINLSFWSKLSESWHYIYLNTSIILAYFRLTRNYTWERIYNMFLRCNFDMILFVKLLFHLMRKSNYNEIISVWYHYQYMICTNGPASCHSGGRAVLRKIFQFPHHEILVYQALATCSLSSHRTQEVWSIPPLVFSSQPLVLCTALLVLFFFYVCQAYMYILCSNFKYQRLLTEK